jgi:hypothetical protein
MLKLLRFFKCSVKKSITEEFNEPRRFDSSRIREEAEDEVEADDFSSSTERDQSLREFSCSSMSYKTYEDHSCYYHYTKGKQAIKVEFVHAGCIQVQKIPPMERIEYSSENDICKDSPASIRSGDSHLIEIDENVLGSDIELSYASCVTPYSEMTHISFASNPNHIPRKYSDMTITPCLSNSHCLQYNASSSDSSSTVKLYNEARKKVGRRNRSAQKKA